MKAAPSFPSSSWTNPSRTSTWSRVARTPSSMSLSSSNRRKKRSTSTAACWSGRPCWAPEVSPGAVAGQEPALGRVSGGQPRGSCLRGTGPVPGSMCNKLRSKASFHPFRLSAVCDEGLRFPRTGSRHFWAGGIGCPQSHLPPGGAHPPLLTRAVPRPGPGPVLLTCGGHRPSLSTAPWPSTLPRFPGLTPFPRVGSSPAGQSAQVGRAVTPPLPPRVASV